MHDGIREETTVPYVSDNHLTHPDAPLKQWCSTRTSKLGPYAKIPPVKEQGSPSFSGQCVSYPCKVCTTLPVGTRNWKQGKQVKGDASILTGTAIATFTGKGVFHGHAAIYEYQIPTGLVVVDQWVSGEGKAIGRRILYFGKGGHSNDGDGFYVID